MVFMLNIQCLSNYVYNFLLRIIFYWDYESISKLDDKSKPETIESLFRPSMGFLSNVHSQPHHRELKLKPSVSHTNFQTLDQ